jgi:glycosyltransferase involved in cell wall biosynthesis
MTQRGTILILSHACNRSVNRAPYAELARLGWRVVIATAEAIVEAGRVTSADPAENDGTTTLMLPLCGRNARLQRYRGLAELIANIRPHWIVADIDPHSWLAIELSLMKIRYRYRLGFVSCENLPFGPVQLARRRGWRGLILGACCSLTRLVVKPQTNIVFCINSAGERLFREAGFATVVKTPLGFPESYFKVDPTARLRIRAELKLTRPTIAYFGRMTPEKGVHVLLDALNRLQGQEWSLLLDDFQPNTEYQRKIRSRVESAPWTHRAHFVAAGHGEVASYMNAADIVVVPSISTPGWIEQYGRVVPEALACGCRVIASLAGALPELLGGHGRLVDENDANSLAEALAQELVNLSSGADRHSKAADYSKSELSATAQAHLWDKVLKFGCSPSEVSS